MKGVCAPRASKDFVHRYAEFMSARARGAH